MKGPELLKYYEDNWETAMGAWFPGERVVYRGKDLFSELSDSSWLELLYFGINGKSCTHEKLEFVNAAYVLCTSYPDPRLWNNRVASLAGTARSTASLALAAATAVSEAKVYGRGPDITASDFITRARIRHLEGEKIGDIVEGELEKYRTLPGFGRPLTSSDERIEPVLRKAKSLKLDEGEHLILALKIQEYLKSKRKRLSINVAGIVSSILADIGTSPRDYYLFCVMAFSAGFFPCFVDAEGNKEGAFFPLSVERVNYKGKAFRGW